MLLPKPGKKQNGRQVFSLGRVRILLDDWIVFVQQGQEWRPVGHRIIPSLWATADTRALGVRLGWTIC